MDQNKTLLQRLLKGFRKQEGLDDLLRMTEHSNGYKRENAVTRLGVLGNPLAIPSLIVRANDWVPQVRIASKKAITLLQKPENVRAFIVSLPDLYHLQNCGRDNHDDLISSVEDYITTVDGGEFMLYELNNEDLRVARCAFLVLLKKKLLPICDLAEKGINHPDVIVRLKSSHYIRGLDLEQQRKVLRIAILDKFMPIRREAFQIYLQDKPSLEFVTKFLNDRHISIREIAIKYLLSNGFDVVNELIFNLSSSSAHVLKCSVWGLDYLRHTDATDKIIPLTKSIYPSVRKQAMVCMISLKGETYFDQITEYLADSSPSVCKEAVRLIAKNGIKLSSEDLFRILSGSEYSHTGRACLTLLRRINKWEALMFLMRLLGSPENDYGITKVRLEESLSIWDREFNKSHSQPSIRQLDALSELYQETQVQLEKKGYRSILFTLNTLGMKTV
ncbi:HEAT repeat domain-containing protein [Zooshikella ganghwensis]|uniref:HEAT repeat domain-containing protein n=1 Tax=Zooshikella ganghwensis TaxID=202772 RepID=UPI000419B53F|nr:HEAT repeat domain-containing protein [Zooshikella ganghwensis]